MMKSEKRCIGIGPTWMEMDGNCPLYIRTWGDGTRELIADAYPGNWVSTGTMYKVIKIAGNIPIDADMEWWLRKRKAAIDAGDSIMASMTTDHNTPQPGVEILKNPEK